MSRCQQAIQGANAFGEFIPKMKGIVVSHGNPPERDAASCVVGLQGPPEKTMRAHVGVRLQVKYGSDRGFLPQPVDVVDASRI